MSELMSVRLAQALSRSLPGENAHRMFAPEFAFGRHRGPVPKNAHRAAVLVVLVDVPVGPSIVLIERSASMQFHSGQVALPGGRVERGETFWDAASREYFEEVHSQRSGHDREAIGLTQLGSLTSIYVYASNNDVEVAVAYQANAMEFTPSPDEVADVILLPLAYLIDPQSRTIGTMAKGTCTYEVPGIRYEGHFIWGATAMILGEFAEVYKAAEVN